MYISSVYVFLSLIYSNSRELLIRVKEMGLLLIRHLLLVGVAMPARHTLPLGCCT